MARKKHKKNPTIFDNKLRLPESYNNLPIEDCYKKSLIRLSEVLRPLYLTTIEHDNETLKATTKPLDFVEAQMLKITKFLMVNADYYLGLTRLDNLDDYFEQVDQIISVAHCNIQVGLAFDEDYIASDSDEALAIATTFFDELDKIFIIKTNRIVCDIDEVEKLLNKNDLGL